MSLTRRLLVLLMTTLSVLRCSMYYWKRLSKVWFNKFYDKQREDEGNPGSRTTSYTPMESIALINNPRTENDKPKREGS